MAEKDNFLLEWYKRLKFEINPFEDEILRPIDDSLCGYVEEKKKLNLFVLEKQSFGMVQAERGFGKTMLLKWLQEQLAPHEKRYVAWYLKANELKTEQDLVKTLIEPLMGSIEKAITHPQNKLTLEQLAPYLAKKLGKKTLFLFIDEIGSLPPKYLSLFKHLYTGNLSVQIILAGTKTELAEASSIGQKDALKINLKGITLDEARQFIQKRIERAGGLGLHPFTPTHFQQLYEKSSRNPALLLKLCREKALQLSLDKNYLEQALQILSEGKRLRKKGFFNIQFMSDEDYARQKALKEHPLTETSFALEPEAATESATEPDLPSVKEDSLPEEIALDPFEEEKMEATKPMHHKPNPPKLELEEETLEAKEVESTEVQYEFQENAEPDIIMPEVEKQTEVVIEEHVTGEKDPKKHKKTPEKTKEAEDTEAYINELAKDFDKV
ncbi:MAG: AAA family ATPase [Nanoarchaeota archaeon]